jgi:hypothetical protein
VDVRKHGADGAAPARNDMTLERIAVLIVAVSVAGAACAELTERRAEATSPGVILSKPGPDPGPTRPIGLSRGAPSIDALLTEFLDAVERQDLDAMHRLRVTKDEYQRIIVPGMVRPGEPPRRISEQPREFFWQINDRKSRYAAEAIANRYGARHYTDRTLRLTRGTREFAWYTTHGQVRLDLHAPELAGTAELRTGSIAEVDGQYKFISFQWDD